MKKSLTAVSLISAALLFGGAAMAQDNGSAKTRAQVIAELQQARESGEATAITEQGFGFPSAAAKPAAAATAKAPAAKTAPAAAGKSRSEVVGELQRARASGELLALQQQGGPSSGAVLTNARLSGDPIVAGK
ncbi:DUF4148 domain-containing protein [Roseateles violae]|uniref:DUF4148 domain-containing protein n=1 Tax=Roseateles violae TaxID=3058042 RepID=A0ABT8DWV9_9BURK|nr:DUF4148 domain-containing protein [Pelomonas sp. PFR6]MDN3920987.1 DUF4148 domain-containing protein [Pelomonas sp. PFR6]